MTHSAAAAGARLPDEPHGQSQPEPHHSVPYFSIFLVLVVLTIVTVLISYHRFSNEFINVALAILVACMKAGCVAAFFMHLKYEGKLIYLIFIVPLILCVLLVTALIPDILMTAPDSSSASLHLFNPPPMSEKMTPSTAVFEPAASAAPAAPAASPAPMPATAPAH